MINIISQISLDTTVHVVRKADGCRWSHSFKSFLAQCGNYWDGHVVCLYPLEADKWTRKYLAAKMMRDIMTSENTMIEFAETLLAEAQAKLANG